MVPAHLPPGRRRPSARALIDLVVNAFRAGGYRIVIGPTNKRSPFELTISEQGRALRLRVYIWNVTPGGRPTRPDEFRIQTTQAIDVAPEGLTLVLGFEPNVGILVSFDPSYHQEFGSSPSVQIQRQDLVAIAELGTHAFMRPRSDGTLEPLVGVTPDMLADHVRALDAFARTGLSGPDSAREPTLAGELEDEPDVAEGLSADRRREAREISQWVRDRRFARRVLIAYGGRCAFCGVNAKLVDGAHIVPVAGGGDDRVANGIAACPTHHRAFDQHLLRLDEEYGIVLNEGELELRGASADDRAALMHGVGERLRACPPQRVSAVDRAHPKTARSAARA